MTRPFFLRYPEIEPDPMRYLIAGLGNMGAEYDGTRHNVGFDVVDTLARRYNVKFSHKTLGDVTLDFGSQRLKGKGSHGGHNGLKDVEKVLGTSKYPRLRIGIGSNFSRGRQVDFVLGKWSDKEAVDIPEVLSHAADTVEAFGTIGMAHTMSQFNRK